MGNTETGHTTAAVSRRWLVGLVTGLVAAVVALVLAEEAGRRLDGDLGAYLGWQLAFLVVLAASLIIARRFRGHRYIPLGCGVFVAISAAEKAQELWPSVSGTASAKFALFGIYLGVFVAWYGLLSLVNKGRTK